MKAVVNVSERDNCYTSASSSRVRGSSCEAGGLLLTFQDGKSAILLFAVKDILDPVYKLALQLNHHNAALCDVPDLLKTVIG